MARGNQRDKAREANQKKMAEQEPVQKNVKQIMVDGREATVTNDHKLIEFCLHLQKKSNTMSGAEMQRQKEKVAEMMRQKQQAADERKAKSGTATKQK